MSARMVAGYAVLSLPFVGLAAFMAAAFGWTVALAGFGLAGAVAGAVFLGAWLVAP